MGVSSVRHRTLGFKLMAGFSVVLFLASVTGVASLLIIERLSSKLHTAANETARKLEIVGEIKAAAGGMRTGQRGVILYSMMKQPKRVSAGNDLYRESAQRILDRIGEIRPMLVTESGRAGVSEIEKAVKGWLPVYERVAAACTRGSFEGELEELVNQSFDHANHIDRFAEELAQLQRGLMAEASRDADRASLIGHWMLVGLGLLSLGVGALILRVIQGANGKLREVSRDLAKGAAQVMQASSSMSDASQSLAQGSAEQAAAIQETSASTTEITSMAERSAYSAGQGLEHVQQVAVEIGHTNRVLKDMSQAMTEINASSDRIARIIRVIDDIAFQTNILALNAAVEAARAGESGLGFAVVADEVRNLAQRSAQAAKDTADLIQESMEKARQGRMRVEEVAKAARSIEARADQVRGVVEEVNSGSQEQSRGLSQINRAVSEMQRVTQQTAADAEESAAASEELAAQARSLQAMAASLGLMVNGSVSEVTLS